jgi:hypothetical protein
MASKAQSQLTNLYDADIRCKYLQTVYQYFSSLRVRSFNLTALTLCASDE